MLNCFCCHWYSIIGNDWTIFMSMTNNAPHGNQLDMSWKSKMLSSPEPHCSDSWSPQSWTISAVQAVQLEAFKKLEAVEVLTSCECDTTMPPDLFTRFIPILFTLLNMCKETFSFMLLGSKMDVCQLASRVVFWASIATGCDRWLTSKKFGPERRRVAVLASHSFFWDLRIHYNPLHCINVVFSFFFLKEERGYPHSVAMCGHRKGKTEPTADSFKTICRWYLLRSACYFKKYALIILVGTHYHILHKLKME